MSRVVDQLGATIGTCDGGQHRHTTIDPRRVNGCRRERSRRHVLEGDGGLPSAPTSAHHEPRRGPEAPALRQLRLDVPDPLQPEPAVRSRRLAERPSGPLGVAHRVPPVRRSESREPRRLARSTPPVERRERVLEPAQRPAVWLESELDQRRDLSLRIGQQLVLIDPGDRPVVPLPCSDPILERGVVEPTLRAEEPLERDGLLLGRIDAVRDGPEMARFAGWHTRWLRSRCDRVDTYFGETVRTWMAEVE